MNAPAPYRVLFLCTGNSARSIMAEGLLNHLGGGRYLAHSAGSHPTGSVNPFALETLTAMQISTEGFRSKSWDEFAQPGAAPLDFVFTVCDRAAGEVCPYWPGQPMTAHWGVEDPAAFEGLAALKRAEFQRVANMLRRRIELFVNLPMASIQTLALQARLDEIGRS